MWDIFSDPHSIKIFDWNWEEEVGAGAHFGSSAGVGEEVGAPKLGGGHCISNISPSTIPTLIQVNNGILFSLASLLLQISPSCFYCFAVHIQSVAPLWKAVRASLVSQGGEGRNLFGVSDSWPNPWGNGKIKKRRKNNLEGTTSEM